MWALASLLFSSCYPLVIASEYLCLVSRGEKLKQVPQPSEAERRLFARVAQIKDFAQDVLGLKATRNYSHYVRLERDYLTAVVSAAPELGFESYVWGYPFVGKLPYRGYFDPQQARREAGRLQKLGYDVLVRPVDAFSTLGYVRDPLFSYMAAYSEGRLADLILHESFHATLFVRSDIALNESLANLVGRLGSRLYLFSKDHSDKESDVDSKGEAELQKHNAELAQSERKQRNAMILQLKDSLAKIYNDPERSRAAKLEAKKQAIARWQEQFRKPNYIKFFESDTYTYLADYPINNAYLALFSLYEDPDQFLDQLFQHFLAQQGDELAALRRFIALCRELGAKHGRKTRSALEAYWKQVQTNNPK